ncbi:ribonuclease H-like domain-containing protein [Tanacetum coccineum]
MLAPSGEGLIFYQAYGNIYAMIGRKAHLLEDKQIPSVGADISYDVQQVCLCMHAPREPHLAALKRIIRYVRGTLDHGLQLYVSTTTQLTAYTDADWAGCPVIVSRSSAEVEYRGAANVVTETISICNLLLELHAPLHTAMLVYCANVSVVYRSTNSFKRSKTSRSNRGEVLAK